jgi:Zn-dependent M28 family amino/carboxypeptidase
MRLASRFVAWFGVVLGCALLVVAFPLGRRAVADDVGGGVTAPPGQAATAEGAFRHLQAFQAIATANGGNRAAGRPGYDLSAQYVAQRLREAGYTVTLEEFEFPFFEERSPPILATGAPGGTLEPADAAAVRTLAYSGAGDVTAHLRAVDLQLGSGPPQASTSGCEAADFKNFERSAVVLVRRGTCMFQVKVDHAVEAGAVGVIIMNEGTDGRTDAFRGQLARSPAIPVVGVPYEMGRSLAAAVEASGGTMVHLVVDAVSGRRMTHNVLADMGLTKGEPSVMAGAHLDGVPEGPGINDNGSGSAAVLEAALRVANEVHDGHGHLRFAFWGGEEEGLLGSRHHLDVLPESERKAIAAYINLDMVGSTNFGRFVRSDDQAGHDMAALLRREVVGYFRDHNLPVEERPGRRGGSDDASFARRDIPSVGLDTGAGNNKSKAQADVFGGTGDRPFDACYHKACDTTDNINRDVLEQNTNALVSALRAVLRAGQSSEATAPKAGDGPASSR